MTRWLRSGIQTRLAVAMPLLTLLILALSFYAVYHGTTSQVESGIEQTLDEEVQHYGNTVVMQLTSSAQLQPDTEEFVRRQDLDPSAPILAIELPDGRQITNEGRVLLDELRRESSEGEVSNPKSLNTTSLTNAPAGMSTVEVGEAGSFRVVNEPILLDGSRIGIFRAALSLRPVSELQEGLKQTFVIVGIFAILASIGLAIWLASLLTRPLRAMADTAAEIDAGDLTSRVEVTEGGEVAVLGDSFNHMLDRLQVAFDRERDFVSDASHELRTPLTVLRGQIELLEREAPKGEELSERVDLLLGEVSRMNSLVDDMLVLARAESGALLQKRQTDVDSMLDDLERDLPLLGRHEFKVEGRPGGTLECDPDRLEQIFRNLVRNAIKYGADPITVSASGRAGKVTFTVSDAGEGVASTELKHLFDRFYRADDSGRSRQAGGSGLGLAIVKALVEAHGGEIKATSPNGSGLQVAFTVPGWVPAGKKRSSGSNGRSRSSVRSPGRGDRLRPRG